jgi:hypothetical protein
MMMNTAAVPTLPTKRVLIGVALSMLAHVVLLTVWRSAPEPVLAPPPAPIVLHLQAPAPVVAAVPAPPPLPATRSKPAATPPHAPRRVIAVDPAASAAAEPAEVVAPQPAEAPPPLPVKKFDLEAARSTARIVGVQDAPNADDAPLARLKKREEEAHIQTESKAARAISAAKRGDCKDGLPGGLLAPLIMLTQKAGTGCKW